VLAAEAAGVDGAPIFPVFFFLFLSGSGVRPSNAYFQGTGRR
jgi:hypothetical protein